MTTSRSSLLSGAVLIALLLFVGALWVAIFAGYGPGAQTKEAAPPSSSSSSTTATSTTTAPPQEWTMDDAREAFAAEGSRVLVLGDTSGAGEDGWVAQWATTAQLPLATWDADEEGYPDEAEDTRIWSAAIPEASAAGPLKQESVWPAQDPDLVLVSFGHFEDSGDDAISDFTPLRADIAERYPDAPIVVILQNPQRDDANEDVRTASATWANGGGLPTIDVGEAFIQEDALSWLLADETMPSVNGARLWAQTVAGALG